MDLMNENSLQICRPPPLKSATDSSRARNWSGQGTIPCVIMWVGQEWTDRIYAGSDQEAWRKHIHQTRELPVKDDLIILQQKPYTQLVYLGFPPLAWEIGLSGSRANVPPESWVHTKFPYLSGTDRIAWRPLHAKWPSYMPLRCYCQVCNYLLPLLTPKDDTTP